VVAGLWLAFGVFIVEAWLGGSDVDEDSLHLGGELGSGGQGRVLRVLGQPEPLVFKQYKITGADSAALRRLVDLPLTLSEPERDYLLRVTSWPLARVMRQGQVRGFLMRAIPDHFFGPNAAGSLKLRELQFLLYPPKPIWGDIVPGVMNAETRIGIATECSHLMALLHVNLLVFGDVSMRNVLWAMANRTQIFVIDCDGVRRLGSRPVLNQVHTPDWDDPQQPPSGPDLDSDRYKLALLVGRVLCGKAYLRPGVDDLGFVPGVPAIVADKVRLLWRQAAGSRGKRPDASQWLVALMGQAETQASRPHPARERSAVPQRPSSPPLSREGSGLRPVIQLRSGSHPADAPGRTENP
jgi:hypothetical protein